LQQKALNITFVKKALGPRADFVITKATEDIRKRQKILDERRRDQARYFVQKEDKEKEELELKKRIELEK